VVRVVVLAGARARGGLVAERRALRCSAEVLLLTAVEVVKYT
jgi:hypothetical protein